MISGIVIDPEFRDLVPPLAWDERQQLEENILAEGCREPLLLWGHLLVSGFNRHEICMKHSVPFEIQAIDFGSRAEAIVWIAKHQMARRNLIPAMKMDLVIRKNGILKEMARKKQSKAGSDRKSGEMLLALCPTVGDPIDVRQSMADEAGVGARTLGNYMRILEDGSPELLEKVKSGEIKVGEGFRMLRTEVIKQLNKGDELLDYIAMHTPFQRDKEANRRLYDSLTQLADDLRRLIKNIEGGTTDDPEN